MATTRKKAETQDKVTEVAQTPAIKSTSKVPVRKRTTAPKVAVYVQHQGKEISEEEAVTAVKADWTGETIKTLDLYIKPEDGAVYYVVNGTGDGKVLY